MMLSTLVELWAYLFWDCNVTFIELTFQLWAAKINSSKLSIIGLRINLALLENI